MALHQSLQQKLLQKLSPQQIQLMKLLQVPTAVLDERIKEEIEENPALEQGEDTEVESEMEMQDEFTSEEPEKDNTEEDYDNIDISEYVHDGDDEVGDYKLRDDNYPEIDDKRVIPHKVETSLIEQLMLQVGMLNISDKQKKIAEHIIGTLD